MKTKEYLEFLNQDGEFGGLVRLLQIAINECHELKEDTCPKVDARIVLDYFKNNSNDYKFSAIKSNGEIGFFKTSFPSLMKERLPKLA